MRYFVLALGLLTLLVLGVVLALRPEEREADVAPPPRAAQPRGVEPEGPPEQLAAPAAPLSTDRSGRTPLAPRTNMPVALGEAAGQVHSLRGSVRDDLGTPLFFFHVQGERRGSRLEQRQIEPDGTFTLSGFEPGEQRVEFSAPGHETSSQVLEFPLAGEHVVVLRRLARITGVVLGHTGEPVTGARLTLSVDDAQFPRSLAVAVTGGAGEFEFDAPLGSFSMHVAWERAPPIDDLEFDLAPGQRVTGLVVRLRQGGVLEGVVHRRTRSSPAGGAPVSAISDGFRKQSFTDRDGRFRLAALAPGHYTVSVGSTAAERQELFGAAETSSASLPSRRASAEVFEGAVTRLEIGVQGDLLTLVRGVVTVNGEPVDGEDLWHFSISAGRVEDDPQEHSWEGARLNLDSQGSFVLAASPGPWRFEVRNLEWGGRMVITRVEQIPARPECDLALNIETGSLSGSVRTLAGDRFSDIWVSLTGGDEHYQASDRVQADVRGLYQFTGVPAGRYTVRTHEFLTLHRFGGPSVIDESIERVEIFPGSETKGIDFFLSPGGGVRLESTASRTDLEQTVLRLSNGALSVECAYLGRAGQFIATGLEPGLFEVTVASGPLVLAIPVSVDVTPSTWGRAVLELVRPLERGK